MNLLKNTSSLGNDLKDTRSMNFPREFIWLILLLLSSLVFTLGFACAAPLAAFGAIAAVAFSRRDALILCGAVWLVSQVVGYTILAYPWNVTSVSWGLVLGGATIIASLASRWIYRHSKTPYLFRLIAAFIAAFAVFQMSLYAVALFVLGGVQDFTADIVIRILAINGAAFVGLMALHGLAVTVGFIPVATETHSSNPTAARQPAA
ncbi:MAG TPA: hypothetical protein VN939_19310 [Chthoniobacterales bacterium]|jgi:hypothetical protein|nr:hypothetical protein [Chthoniobacterales bacterium]